MPGSKASKPSGQSHKRKAPKDAPQRATKKPKKEIDSRFKYSSFTQQLSEVHVGSGSLLAAASTSNLEQADDGQEDLDLLDSEFGRAVSRLRLLDTSAVALELVHTLSPLCRSLPLILLHRSTISATLLRLLPLATGPYPLDLVTALADTGSDLVLPHFVSFLDTLIDVAFAATDAQIASKALNAIAHLFRTLGGSLVQDETLSQTAWITVAAALSGVDSLALHPKPSDSDLEDPNDPSTDTETENDHVATQLQGLSHSSMDVDPVKQVSDPLLADVDQDQVDEKEEAEHHEPDVNQKPKRARRGPGSAQLRHLLASAYAYFVRKCANTPATLQLLIAEMCSTLSSLQDNLTLSQSIAWLIVEASKSTSTGLHSRFPTILKAFATALASRSIIIEKALVGLIHHLGPSRPGSETGDNERETLCNAVFALFQADSSSHLSLFRTLVGTNKSRGIPEKARPQWFKLAATAGCQAKSQPQLFAQLASWSLIRAGVSDLGHAHQSGQSILDAFFQLPVDLCMTACMLLKDQWKLFDDFVPDRLAAKLLALPDLLDALQRMAALSEHGVWIRLPESRRTEIGSRVDESRASMLADAVKHPKAALSVLRLQSFSKPSPKELQDLITNIVQADTTSTVFGQVLASALDVLSAIESAPSLSTETIQSIFNLYNDDAGVLKAIKSLSAPSISSLEKVYQGIASSTQALRHATAQLVESWSRDEAEQRAARSIIEVEEVPLTFHESRERCLKLRRLVSLAKSLSNGIALELIVRYLTGNLKINLKPLWSEAVAGIVTLAPDHEELVWRIAGHALLATASADFKQAVEAWKNASGSPTEDRWDDLFEDRSLDQLSKSLDQNIDVYIQDTHEEHINLVTFEAQLLSVFAQAPQPAQKHSRQLVPLYLDVFGPSPKQGQGLPSKLLRQRLSSWLDMFAHFHNPKALSKSWDLYDSHLRHLSQGDNAVQKLALSAILTWKLPTVTPFSDQLFSLLETATFRDTLLSLDLAPDADLVPTSSRSDLLQIVIRLFYGLLTARHAFPGRRIAVLQSMRQCQSSEIDLLIDLMIEPFSQLDAVMDESTGRKALGFLSLLSDVLKTLSETIHHRILELGQTVLKLARVATTQNLHQAKEIQRESLKRVCDASRSALHIAAEPNFTSEVFATLISPRLASAETSQIPGALIDLSLIWSNSPDLADQFEAYDERLLPTLFAVLQQKGLSHEHSRICDLALNLVTRAEEGSQAFTLLVQRHSDTLLKALSSNLNQKAQSTSRSSLTDDLCKAQVSLVTKLASFSISSHSARHLLETIQVLLGRPHIIVPERMKQELLHVMQNIMSQIDQSVLGQSSLRETIFGLFATLRHRNSRVRLAAVYQDLAAQDEQLQATASILTELNAFSVKRSEEPDFDRRLAAFGRLTDPTCPSLSPLEWHPILCNLFFNMQDVDEMSIRGNASLALKRFITLAAAKEDERWRQLTSSVFLPGLRKGLKSREELIRTEYLQVLSAAVANLPGYSSLSEMKCLLVNGDQEANFFLNIHHIQLHRRTRALRRLADEAEAGHLSSRVLSDTLLPLLHHFFPSQPGDSGNADLINETVQCISRVASVLNWGTWRPLAHQYLRMIKADTPALRAIMRATTGILRSFHFDMNTTENASVLSHTGTNLLPLLFKTIDNRDVAEEASRLALAEGVASIVSHLPSPRREVEASSLFMSVSRILRSKEQATRDAARNALSSIVLTMGNDALAMAVKEMRTALQRGPQLHVLAFTTHSLLVKVFQEQKNIDVTAALSDIVDVLDTDLFGPPSKDREAKDFRSRSTYREIKSSKSADSFQILASIIEPDQLSTLLHPLRSVLASTEVHKILRLVDDVLAQISHGLQKNNRIGPIHLLNLCHSLLSQSATFLQKGPAATKSKTKKDFAVVLERSSGNDDYSASNAHHFACFGLDVLNASFKKNRFDLQDAAIVARLDPLVRDIGNTLYSKNDLVLSRAFKAASSLLHCPLSSVDQAAPLMVKQILQILIDIGGTESEVSQSAIRGLTSIIRDCKSVKLGEKQLTELLQLITPDLEDPDRQPILFGLIRSIMSRKLACPEIYDLMDRIAEYLVANQSASVRELCRAIYLQFLLDYPQGKGRLQSSLTLLARNISFTHESGRLSTLEIIHAIFTKFSADLLEDSAQLFFMSLILCVANDDSTKCRESASALLKLLVERVSNKQQEAFFGFLTGWIELDDKPELSKTALSLIGMFCGSLKDPQQRERASLKALTLLWPYLVQAVDQMVNTEESSESDTDVHKKLDWARPYQAMQSILKIFTMQPQCIDATKQASQWHAVRSLLLHPHAWIRVSAARLLGALFAANPAVQPQTLAEDHPLSRSVLIECADKMSQQLQSRFLSSALAMQIVKNLFFVGKTFSTLAVEVNITASEEEEVESEDVDHPTVDLLDKDRDPLTWLFSRLARQARLAHTRRPSPYAAEKTTWGLQPLSIFQWFAAMIQHISVEKLEARLFVILTPLFRVIEDTSKADDQMEELQKLAHEVQELLQTKVGDAAFLRAHAAVSQSVSQHRQARREKASLQTIKDPSVAAQSKMKGGERKKEARKRKSNAYKAARMSNM